MIPRATYRLQLQKTFPFARVAELASYFASLGISHVYLSPILMARPGSTHGYDVVDHTIVNPELGGEAAFRLMAAKLRSEDIGIIVDIVPNHMAVTSIHNRWWQDILENGPRSSYADYFDIDWRAPGLEGRVLAPFLGASPRQEINNGELKLDYDKYLRKYVFAYYSQRFPLRPEDQESMQGRNLPSLSKSELAAILARQNYLLADWREADARINWRRFFAITDLSALRVERDEVFDAVHAKIFNLFTEGLIDGVRVDHVDGLSDPRAYCRKLRKQLNDITRRASFAHPAYIIVEKILAFDERLPGDWQVDGTTGYDFMNEISAVQHAPDRAAILDRLWRQHGGRGSVFEREERAARRQVLARSFGAQLKATARAFFAARRLDGLDERDFRNGLKAVIREMRCYRTYATGRRDSPTPGTHFSRAIEQARELNPSQAMAIAAIAEIMADTSDNPTIVDAVRRFNQLCASVAAKAVEDTALYRYGRLLSRNDVGFDPRQETMSIAEFSARMHYRRDKLPASLLTTATHDHKRGEDARARLAVLSEIPLAWRKSVAEWFVMNASTRAADIRRADEYQLYQTLFGVWPPGGGSTCELGRLAERLQGWSSKYLREAKLRSRWRAPNEGYENLFHEFVGGLLTSPSAHHFRSSMNAFVSYTWPAARANSLAQCALRCTLPGVPDLYQGCELLDFSMVDPDNRQPVDYDARLRATGADANSVSDDRLKLALIAALLGYRKSNGDIFRYGNYRRLSVRGERRDHLIAFERQLGVTRFILLAATRCAPALCGGPATTPTSMWWSDTAVDLGTDRITDFEPVVGPPATGSPLSIASALATSPVFAAVLR